jgi:phage gp16-like protein
MMALACDLLLLAGSVAASAPTNSCTTPDEVAAVQKILGQQGAQIRALEQENAKLRATVNDYNRRLWNAMQRQRA